jgi:hypothetical protein
MKCTALFTLALAVAVAARPAGRGGRGGRRGGKATSKAVTKAASSTAAAGVSTTAAAAVTDTAAAATATAATDTAAAAVTDTAAAAATDTAAAAATDTAAAAASTTAAAAGAVNTVTSATANNPDLQNSLTLDPSVIAAGFQNDGQAVPAAGQVASLTSSNNFINFCATVPNLPITNGKQITTGSCNPAPMGIIPSTDNMPSAKFTFPTNGGTVAPDTAFTISVAVANFQTGAFVNAQQNYFAAPQQLNGAGQIVGHSHVVVEKLDSLTQTTPTDPKKFFFFKGLNAAAVNGVLTADVSNGLPAGVYKVSTINTAANHQPVLVPVAQHGSVDDVVYFTVTADAGAVAGLGAANATAAAGAATDTAVAAAGAATNTAVAAAGAATDTAAAAAATNTAAAAATNTAAAAAAATNTAAAAAATKGAAAATSAAATKAAAATTSAAKGAATTAAAKGKGKRSLLSRNL